MLRIGSRLAPVSHAHQGWTDLGSPDYRVDDPQVFVQFMCGEERGGCDPKGLMAATARRIVDGKGNANDIAVLEILTRMINERRQGARQDDHRAHA